jgi:hypothetical protein
VTRATVVIRSAPDRAKVCRWAQNVEPGTVIEFRKARRSTDQNALLWAMLTDVARQVDWYGQKLTAEDWKDVFTASMRKSRVIPGIEAGSFVVLGMRTSDMTKDEFSNLIELIHAFAAERGVVFSGEADAAQD